MKSHGSYSCFGLRDDKSNPDKDGEEEYDDEG